MAQVVVRDGLYSGQVRNRVLCIAAAALVYLTGQAPRLDSIAELFQRVS